LDVRSFVRSFVGAFVTGDHAGEANADAPHVDRVTTARILIRRFVADFAASIVVLPVIFGAEKHLHIIAITNRTRQTMNTNKEKWERLFVFALQALSSRRSSFATTYIDKTYAEIVVDENRR
jgi:tRNA pseudouridine-54 N-methylase